ncbi:uracil-DNA glycosylase family protein [Bacillus anthracis]|uniref:uracil-DNA glycosylase family protein n=1 Tax=Bacillus cereus group TaxID=86661 RepID=UPI0022E98A74|nr:uracil-DNA glycosylase family protein [Bacillus cereus group sp. BcHK104]MDA1987121.1 hypothetical protein [Bacillus cereus group sp. BcHK104]
MCHFEKGSKNDITIVFSCPGRKEEEANKPAAGKTGENLKYILTDLNKFSELDWQRGHITITNSWDQIEYNGKNKRKRSEASEKEILMDANLNRLYEEIKHTRRFIICFGDNAIKAVKKLESGLQAKIIETHHLSLRKLNRSINKDIHGKEIIAGKTKIEQNANTHKRLQVICQKIKKQISDNI